MLITGVLLVPLAVAAANAVLNRYLIQTRRPEDLDGLATLPLFLSLRAAIRAKVAAERLEVSAEEDRSAGLAAARDKQASNAAEAIAYANSASVLAAEAQTLANADVQAAPRKR